MADIPEEHLTEELLDRLLASASIEQYLDEGLVSARTLTDYLFDRMEAHDLRRADVVRASGLNATVVYDIFSGKSKPLGALPPYFKDQPHQVPLSGPVTDGDGPAQQAAVAALDMDELSRHTHLSGHAVGLQRHGPGAGGQLGHLQDLTVVYFPDWRRSRVRTV